MVEHANHTACIQSTFFERAWLFQPPAPSKNRLRGQFYPEIDILVASCQAPATPLLTKALVFTALNGEDLLEQCLFKPRASIQLRASSKWWLVQGQRTLSSNYLQKKK